MAEIIKLSLIERTRGKAVKRRSNPGVRPEKLGGIQKQRTWTPVRTGTLSIPVATDMMRAQSAAPPVAEGQPPILESGALAFRRESNGELLVLLISRKRSKKWGIPKGKVSPHLTFPETAAKEAFEEAGVVGCLSPSSVGMFRATKRSTNSQQRRTIEVWVYLLEVTETLPNWPEKGERATRWVPCDVAARQLREPVLAHICRRLAQD
jgi:8-oxo-dGTP pyrophosphatase MutT (NUDIX family)